MSLVLDTHALLWYASASPRLSAYARHAIDEALLVGPVYVSAISLVEVVYLAEKGRLPAEAVRRMREVQSLPETPIRVAPLDEHVAGALARVPRGDVPDMPDRIIAATALHLRLPLVTRDRKIQLSEVETVW